MISLVINRTRSYVNARTFLCICEMSLTSTPRKAVVSKPSINCLICDSTLNSNERIAVFGRSQYDVKGTISEIIGADLQAFILDNSEGQLWICTRKCFPRLKKIQKLTSTLGALKQEIKQQILGKEQATSIRLKHGLSDAKESMPEDRSVQTMKSRRKTLFPQASTAEGKERAAEFFTQTAVYAPVRLALMPLLVQALPVCSVLPGKIPAPSFAANQVSTLGASETNTASIPREAAPHKDTLQGPSVQVSNYWL